MNPSSRTARSGPRGPMVSLLIALSLATLTSAAASQRSGAPDVRPDVTSFGNELDAATALVGKRKWKEGRAALLALLQRHAGAAYARPALAEIGELVAKCAFWSVTREPDPKTLIKGELASFDRSTGRVRLRYSSAESWGDFVAEGAPNAPLRLHPLQFRGSYTLELSGTPESVSEATLFLALGDEGALAVDIGLRRPGAILFFGHRLLRTQSGSAPPETLDTAEPAEFSKDKVTVLVSVSEKTIDVKYDGKRILTAANPLGVSGQWGLQSEPCGAVALTVAGNAEPAWLDGLVDEKVQAERAAFEKTYVQPAEFAAWPVLPKMETEEQALTRLLGTVQLPGSFTPEQVAIMRRVNELLAGRDIAAALRYVEERSDAEIPPPARECILVIATATANRPALALLHLQRLRASGESSFELRLLEAYLLSQAERGDESIELMRKLVAERPSEPLLHLELARRLLLNELQAEARAALEAGVEAAGASPELEALRVQLAKATLGPAFRRPFAADSTRFAVVTDVDYATARAIGRELDEAWIQCGVQFGELAASGERTRAFVLSGRASYLGYVDGIADGTQENTLGVYSRLLDQIVVWNQPNRAELMRVLRHECVHRFNDLTFGVLPRWLDEGLAEYFCVGKDSEGKWHEGALHPDHVAQLRRGMKLQPLSIFLRASDEDFIRGGVDNYTQAWGLVHFLRRGKDEAAHGFLERLTNALRGRTDSATAVEQALEGIDLQALQSAYLEHLRALGAGR